ncbi:signal peptidase I [Candidatus Kaiserbacteria bacterium RIFCSPHIGHO2_01_FULL_46_22]|uniref:Signal peptidase I n=1 Tax=Candidatus Kaiserbacteria bacterium RIFCSPHIGHO2_01_FULL_46_22 TaxID=1798475 RepID=A0A1F6BXU3_9BACT|nr:MAG: signal peptidase I [Candidatus Kaiserbacteria bacterium RIFCSPHIGHO2_01_FULL_46_22]
MKRPQENSFTEILRFALIALLIVLPIRWFIAQPFIVSGASMENTFHNNEYLIVDQVTYRFEEPKRGDVVIFHYPVDHSKYFIKRIIGLPGETVLIDGQSVTIINDENPEGITLTEPYATIGSKDNDTKTTLEEDQYFVLGDNRDHSSDSRVWGVVTSDEIVGRAFLRLYPPTRASVLPGSSNFND